MAKTALDYSRLTAFAAVPEELTIVTKEWMLANGYDLGENKHPLYDPRAELTPEEDFVRNVNAFGVIEPIIIVKEGNFVLVAAGRQRVKAAVIANKRRSASGLSLLTVPAMLKKGDEASLAEITILDNVRRATNVVDDAEKAVALLRLKGGDYKAVGLTFCVDVRTVKQWETLMSCVEPVKKAVKSGRLTLASALELSKLPPPEQRKQLADAITETGGEESTKRIRTETVKAAVNGQRAIPKPPAKHIKLVYASPVVPSIIKTYEGWRTGQITEAEALQELPWLAEVLPQTGGNE